MTSTSKKTWNIYTISFIAVMAALIYVITMFRFPLLGSKVHFANAVCLLAGLLLGPVPGGVAAGLGSALYDALAGGYPFPEVMITFVSKFAMAWVAGLLAAKAVHSGGVRREQILRIILAVAVGALTYVALYMLKTYIFQRWVYSYPLDTTWATMLSKLPASLINAGLSIVATPIFYHALVPALKGAGLWEKIQGK